MSYRTSDQTGDTPDWGESTEMRVFRKLTASQGARSTAYEVRDETGRVRFQSPLPSRAPRAIPYDRREPATVAAYEHTRHLLRRAADAAHDLWLAADPRDSALAGTRLNAILGELWDLRDTREEDWAACLNLLQVVAGSVEFEELGSSQRRAMHRVFEEDILGRAVGRSETERLIQLLTDGGFDIWRGLSEIEVGDGDNA
jgi:hypothetical protein